MDEIGSILREARETKGFTLSDIHEQTRISVKFLKALESGQYDVLPTAASAKGYLRNYARFLGLNPEPILERYDGLKQQRPLPPPPIPQPEIPEFVEPPPTIDSSTFYAPSRLEVGPDVQRSGLDTARLAMIVSLVAFIGLVGIFFVPRLLGSDSQELTPEILTDAVQDYLNAEENVPDQPTPTPLTSTQVITPTGRTTGSDLNAEILPTRSPLPATMETIDIRIDVTERSWISVEVDSINVFEGQMEEDEFLEYTADDFVRLRTGNAAGVNVRINEIELGRLGNRGQVVDERWETTK